MPTKIFDTTSVDSLRIIPFGGCGEFGMNLTAYVYRKKLYVVDCGVMFPDPTKLGVDAVIPKVDAYFKEAGRVEAYIITHGHEDHIGALPYILKRWPAPLYCTAWTAELIRSRLDQKFIGHRVEINVVEPGDIVESQGISFEWVHVNHSIPMACALLISTKNQKVFHTGDFKVEKDPIGEEPMNFQKLNAIGKRGIDLLLADSTNAHVPGVGAGEKSVMKPLQDLISAASGAVFVTTFASNLWRLQAILEVCHKLKKRVHICGRGVETTLAIAEKLKMYSAPKGVLVDEDKVKTIPRKKLVVIATGSQGEWRATLSRIARGDHRTIKVHPGDTVIFSSRTIPGNEKPIIETMDGLKRSGANIITWRQRPDVHVSGHGHGGEIMQLMKALQPKHFLPVHGTFTHLDANLHNALEVGIKRPGTFVIEDGDAVELSKTGELKSLGRFEMDVDFVDAESYVVLDRETLRDRLRIGESGLAILTGQFSRQRNKWTMAPEISLHGLLLPDHIPMDQWLKQAAASVAKRAQDLVSANINDPGELLDECRMTVRRSLFDVLRKKPVVIPRVQIV